MKKLKFLALALVMVFAISALTGCFGFLMEHIEDTNGTEDTSLAVIGKDEVVTWSKSYVVDGEVMPQAGQVTQTYSADKFSGVRGVWYVNVGENIPTGTPTIYFNFDVTVSEGNFYIVLVHDGQVEKEISTNGSSIYTVSNPTGNYTVYIAGESAKVSVSTSITYPLA